MKLYPPPPIAPRVHPALLLPLLVATGCMRTESRDAFPVDISTLESVSTVLRLTWTSEQPASSWVEYELESGESLITPVAEELSTDHEHILLGIPAGTEVHWQAHHTVDGEKLTAQGTATSGLPPADVGGFEVTTYDPDQASGKGYLMGVLAGTPGAIFIIDRQGHWIWYHPVEAPLDTELPPVTRAVFHQDSNDILYSHFDTELGEEEGYVERLSIEGEPLDQSSTPQAHHAFTQLPEGTLAWLASDVRTVVDDHDGTTAEVVGDTIWEQGPDGTDREVFSVWDWFTPQLADLQEHSTYADGLKWTHANDLSYYSERDTLLLSVGALDTVVEVDRVGASPYRAYGSGKDAFNVAQGSLDLWAPRAPSYTENDTLLLTSTYDSGDGLETIVVEYAIDPVDHVLEEIWSYGTGEGLYAHSGSQACRLANDNTLVSWGTTGVVREVTPEGELVWELQADAGNAFLGVTLVDDLYEGQ